MILAKILSQKNYSYLIFLNEVRSSLTSFLKNNSIERNSKLMNENESGRFLVHYLKRDSSRLDRHWAICELSRILG